MARPGCLSRMSGALIRKLEAIFYRLGMSVATYPKSTIMGSLLVTALCGLGLLNFYMEQKPELLWIPQDSDYVRTLEWQHKNFPANQRMELVLYEADNVLKADYIREMARIRREVKQLQITNHLGETLTQADMCFKVPALGGGQKNKLQDVKQDLFPDRDPNEDFDWSIAMDKRIYHQFYAMMPRACLHLGILEIWGEDEAILGNLTDEQVLRDINTVNKSFTYDYPLNFRQFLGGVTEDRMGRVVAARAAITQIMMQVDRSMINSNKVDNNAGTDMDTEVDPALFAWEGEFIKYMRNHTGRPQGLQVYMQSQRSFSEISSETIYGDVTLLVMGEVILFMYVQLMLGRFNMVENRPVLSVLGLLSVFLAVIVSFGICAGVGLAYSPVHSILPLLMLGLGVDDMFVVVQCWQNMGSNERKAELHKRMGVALRRSGVAITVTSFTDFAAFIIGSTTVLPALRSFCVYAALGMVCLYGLQITFFIAWFTLDQARLEDHRNGLVWCYRHKDWTPNKCSQNDLCQMFFEKVYSKVLLMTPVKVLVALLAAALLGTSIWGVTSLRQEFNPVLFIPQSSYLFKFLTRAMALFPEAGERGTVYLGPLDYGKELRQVCSLAEAMEKAQYVSTVDSWCHLMVKYVNDSKHQDISGITLDDAFFSEVLSDFLYSPSGTRFQNHFHFDGNLTGMKPAPRVLASKFDYRHGSLTVDNRILAMDQVKELVNQANLSEFAAPVAQMYAAWETDKVITTEMARNLSLALVTVLGMILLLLANVRAAVMVLLCVALTLVDVMALMSWWDLTIDTVTCIHLVLCIGLCVDYSAHIALHFLQVNGSRNERVRKTVRDMGPPVLNGAFSTFLAFIFLAFSDSHVFQSFFKIFMGVFIFGVFHGLVFLPVLLSVAGPDAYPVAEREADGGEEGGEKGVKDVVEERRLRGRSYVTVPVVKADAAYE